MVPARKERSLAVLYLEWMLDVYGLFSGFLEEPLYTAWEVKTLKGLTSIRMVILKKVKTEALTRMLRKLETLCMIGENVKWYSHCGK